MKTYLAARWGELSTILSASGAAAVVASWLLGDITGKQCLAGVAAALTGYLMPETKAAARAASVVLAAGLALSLAACAEWNASVASVNSYVGAQVKAQAANQQGIDDNAAQVWAALACLMPYGEVVRNGAGNPNFAEAILALCGAPSGFTTIHTAPAATAVTTIPTLTVPAPAAKP